MTTERSALALLLVLSVSIFGSCAPASEQPTKTSTATPTPIGGEELGPGQARDAALAYVSRQYGERGPAPGLDWAEARLTPEGLVGSETFEYTAGDWAVTVSYPIVAPEAVVYQVLVANESTGFHWEGEVDAGWLVTERAGPIEGRLVACWYGKVVSLPEGAQFDDYLAVEPEGAGEIGVEAVDPQVQAEIEALRSRQEPGNYAHFWGTLTCGVPDSGGCQLLVSRLRPEGPEEPFFEPDVVDGWEGTIVSNAPGAQFDDYLILAGDFPVGFGIDGAEPTVVAQLESLRDTGTTVRLWGQVTCPAIDSYGTQVSVTRIEVVP